MNCTREGPYRQGAAKLRMSRIVAEIRSTGLEPFLRERRIERSQIGPLAVSSGRMSPFRPNLEYWRAFNSRVRHLKGTTTQVVGSAPRT